MEKPADGKMQELFNFMVDKLGGESSVRNEFLRNKIAALEAESITIGNLFDDADENGWSEWLRSLNISEFAKMVRGKNSGSKPMVARSGKRMTMKEKEELHKQLLAYLKENPWSQSSSLAKIVGLPTRTVGLHLKALREKGLVTTEGDKAKMRYNLA